MGEGESLAVGRSNDRAAWTDRRPQQLRDLAVTVATVLPGQFDDIGSQPLLVVTTVGRFTLRRAMLTERRAGTTLGDLECAPNVLDHGTPARGA